MRTFIRQTLAKEENLGNKGLFCDVVSAVDQHEGFLKLLQLGGLGKLRPNTVMLKWNGGFEANSEATRLKEAIMFDIMYHNRAFIMLRDNEGKFGGDYDITDEEISCIRDIEDQERNESTGESTSRTMRSTVRVTKSKLKQRYIDVWWIADDGGFTMLVPFILQKHDEFKDATLRVMVLAFPEIGEQQTVKLMSKDDNDAASAAEASATLRGALVVGETLTEMPKASFISLHEKLCDFANIGNGDCGWGHCKDKQDFANGQVCRTRI